jgi:hypothetical protein
MASNFSLAALVQTFAHAQFSKSVSHALSQEVTAGAAQQNNQEKDSRGQRK